MSIKGYFKESFAELVHKVTWPTWNDLQNSAGLVMIATLIIALVVSLMDFSFSKLMEFVYRMLY